MTQLLKQNKYKSISIIVAVILLFASFFVMETGNIEAYAASMKKPSVSLSNASSTSIKISWKKVTGAKKYTVYRSTKKSTGYKAVKTTTGVSFTNSSLKTGTTYYYKVKAINGKISATSAVVSKKAVPAKTTSVKATAQCSSIKLSWAKAKDVTGYEIYYSDTKNGKYKKLASTKSTSYTNKSLKVGKTRYYKVRAYKKSGKKTYYGAYSSVVSKKTAHAPSTSWTITKKATCSSTGTQTNKCKYCKKTISQTIPKDDTTHSYNFDVIPADKTYESYKVYTCTKCGDKYSTKKKAHKYSADITEPTCIEEGYTINKCSACEYIDEASKRDIKPALGHKYSANTTDPTCTEDGYTINKCTSCNYEDETSIRDVKPAFGHNFGLKQTDLETGAKYCVCDTCKYIQSYTVCYIDLDTRTISNPSVARFGNSSSNMTEIPDKLDLDCNKFIEAYEITGKAENLTIDINAYCDAEVRLNGCTIINTSKDCIAIKDKSPDESLNSTAENPVEDKIPDVAITAVSGSENVLESMVSANAIDGNCDLELKGRGVLILHTTSSTITNGGKIEIKNLTLDITSEANRGIDTKSNTYNDNNMITGTYYSNITIKPNATVTINAADDGIRCKNMTFEALAEGDVATVVDIKAGGDALQLEGKKGITMYSGILTLKGNKSAMNNKSGLENIFEPAQIIR